MKRSMLILVSLLSTYGVALAQKIVTGKVTTTDGSALGGVTVLEKGKNTQSITTNSGMYKITVQENATLIFRHVGYNQIEKALMGQSVINISLSENSSSLDEVVVTAFGVKRDRKTLGYSTPIVAGSDVSETQRESFFQGLQGRVPGLSINSTSGMPGASAQIVLRGFASISGDNNTLIVVDGVPINNSTLNENDLASNGANRDLDYSNRAMDINPDDIETYTILKGPEATAQFGSQGAGGAILITTKKGKAGKFTVNYSLSGRVETVNKYPERQYVYAQGTNGVYAANSVYSMGPKYAEGVTLYKDNVNNFFRTGYNQKHNLSFEGGSEKVTYRWSNEYSNNTGIVPNTSYKRFSTRLNGTAKFNDKLEFNTSFNYINSQNDKVRKGNTGYLITLMRFNPLFDVRDWIDEKGNRVLHSTDIYNELDNPFWDVYRNTANDDVNRLLATSNITYRATNWLSLNGIIGIDFANTQGQSVYHPQSYSGSGSSTNVRNGSMNEYQVNARVLSGSFMATANTKIGRDISFRANLGTEFKDYNTLTNSQYGEDFYDPNFYSINNTFPSTRLARSVANNFRTVGFLAQAGFGYLDNLLYLNLTGRLDAASRMMPNNPYFGYPSASLAFNFSDLSFFKNKVQWLSDGKYRISVGTTGKAPFKSYYTLSNLEPKLSTGGGFAYGVNGGNPDLKAEKTRDFETGVEFGFFKRRLTFDFSYFNRLSTGQIILPRLSYGSGFVLRMMNGGEVKTYGTELQVNVNPIKKEDFSWDMTFNFTQYKGKVLSLAEELPELYDSDTWVLSGVRSSVMPGYSIGTLTGTQFKRNERGDILINPQTGLPIAGTDKYYPIGDRIPDYTLGIVNKFNYKNFYLTFLWDLRKGGDVLNGLDYRLYTYGQSVKTLNREDPRVIQGVLEDGLENTANPTVNHIAVTPYSASAYYMTNIEPQMFIEKNIYAFRLRDVTLRYALPKHLTQRISSQAALSVFFTATDLFLFTNYTGLDPESNSNTAGLGGIGGYGIDYGNMAKPRGFNFGLNMRF
ncbi:MULTISPECIES: SusC/RagA family TonB-linked outer membrane protein [Sphingobacterium]|uniref:SusC/RagA family TonB-linked outer membrane protein n=2 Tax=Sphingobacterium TaxID=28453 RepID=UPI0008A2D1FD|nr:MULTISPECIES: SusC/RagA family TonB-linked outer membrane protein [Sphingobacterium]OFV14238.1 SusC/RagA family TonB-linked outer membrane protein [Sphingobacterium sp. HMSC13C05]